MTTLLLILWVIVVVLLLFVLAMRPQRSKHAMFELERLGGKDALRRERLIGDVLAFRQFLVMLFVLFVGILSVQLWQWSGVAGAVIVLLVATPLSRAKLIQKFAKRIYEKYEKNLFRLFESTPVARWFIVESRWTHHDQGIESVEHLLHLVEAAGHVLTPDQQHLIRRGMKWHTKTLGDVMTRRKDIVSVAKGDLLGPLLLNDLHKSGHHRFPVIQKDLDHVVGQINLANQFEVDADRHSQTAEKLMASMDVRLSQDTLLPEALKQLVAHPAQLALVLDDDSKTVGIASLKDILDALLSHR